MNDFLLLIDGSSLLTTQFYGNLPREILYAKTLEEKQQYYHKIMKTSKGVYTNAVYGFLRTLFRILRDQKPGYIAVAWDLTRDTFRREIWPEYKGNRTELMEPLRDQFDLCQQVLQEMNFYQFMDPRYEADDFVGSVSARFESEIPVRILTKDNDYLQLVTEHTRLWLMHSTAEKTDELYKKYHMDRSAMNVPERAFELTPELVLMEFGVSPEHINSLKGLMGDPSDNIKGVPGVGPQTAVRLIREYGTVDALYQALSDLDKEKEAALKLDWKNRLGITRSPLNFLLKTSEEELVGEQAARISEKLATIKKDIDLEDLSLEDLKTAPDMDGIRKVLLELEFESLNPDFEQNEDKAQTETAFVMSGDADELEKTVRDLKKAKVLGVCYFDGAGLAVAGDPSRAVFFPEEYFITRETLKNALLKLFSGNPAIYTTEGKNIVKLTDLTVRDITISAYLLDPLRASYPYDYISSEYLGKTVPDRTSYLGKETLKEALADNPEKLRDYMCVQALTAFLSGPVLDEKLRDSGMLSLYEEIELPCMRVLSRMEDAGILVKSEELKAYGDALKENIDRLESEIFELSGESFNINSPKQLGTVLFEKLKLPYGKKTKSGYSTNADILEKLEPDYPVVKKILEYRTLTKLRSTYAEGLRAFIAEDGRIHGSFNQTITATGRLSSTNPNLQNIPVRIELGSRIRRLFVPKEGCVFIDADYSQIELRILAHLSGDENLIRSYSESRDIHAITASQVFHVPLEEVTPLQRRNAKAVNFGIVYGISAFSLSEDLSITREEAKEYMRRYFEAYPGIERYLDQCVKDAAENGYVKTMYGRIRPIPELRSANFNLRSFGERVAMNSPIQGSAADIMKIAMIHVENRLNSEGLKSRIVLQVHDELLVEALLDEADQVQRILVEEMENAADLKVKLEVEAKRGYSWYDAK